MTDQETVIAILKYALGPGAALVVYWVTNWFIQQLTDSGHQPSPFKARWINYGTSIAVPTILYGILVLLANTPWEWATYILAVLSAFGLSQFIHGQTSLPKVPVKAVPLTPTEVAAKIKD
jgi:hypothetical protein